MDILVQKFGGMALADPGRMKNVAKQIASAGMHSRMVVVVSAQGQTTERLIDAAMQISSTPTLREMDVLLATGEMQSAALLAMALNEMGVAAVSLNAHQMGLRTTDNHGAALITMIDPTLIQKEVRDGRVVVCTGFQGQTACGDITTLGRGASDTSAVAIAAALRAPMCELYKEDVDGVYTADPKIVPSARKLHVVCYDDMIALSAAGAKVLHMRAVVLAKANAIKVLVCRSGESCGTIIKEACMENFGQMGIAIDRNISCVSIFSEDVRSKARDVLCALTEAGIAVDLVSLGTREFSFTVHSSKASSAYELTERVAPGSAACNVSLAKLSIIGAGMPHTHGVAAGVLDSLASVGIIPYLITTSETKLSVLVRSSQVGQAARVVHRQLGLEDVCEE